MKYCQNVEKWFNLVQDEVFRISTDEKQVRYTVLSREFTLGRRVLDIVLEASYVRYVLIDENGKLFRLCIADYMEKDSYPVSCGNDSYDFLEMEVN